MAGVVAHDHVIDIRGLCCSAPVLRLTDAFREYAGGDVALVISDKCSMRKDIPAYCSMTGHELLKQEEKDGLFHFWIGIR
ncbi:MAG: sulfurtransferase TusA family protein [Granulosicoccaceae bacterium]|jgi:tRNA 2-thiouridine synthesizing protein A